MSSGNPNNHIIRTIARTIAPIAAALVVIGLGATPSYARPDPGPPISHTDPPGGCLLQRVGDQFVRCDNLTGNGVAAPAWIAQAHSTAPASNADSGHEQGTLA